MWKPGNLVTIKGVVYRVKRTDSADICGQCALNKRELQYCAWPYRSRYLLPGDCYLKRVSP